MKKDKSPAYQHYPDKAIAGTAHLTPLAFKAYWMVLWWMWLHSPSKCRMKDEPQAWRRATIMDGVNALSARREIMETDPPMLQLRNGYVECAGLKKEAQKQKAWHKKSSVGGKASGKSRLDKALRANQMATMRDPLVDQNEEPKGNTPTPIPSLSLSPIPSPDIQTNKRPPISPKGEFVYSDSFEEFWKAYPRKKGKGAAYKAWCRAKGLPPTDTLIAKIIEQGDSGQWRKDDGEYIPHPATWINERRWDDEADAVMKSASDALPWADEKQKGGE